MNHILPPGPVAPEESARFAAAAGEVMRRPLSASQGAAGIGTLREKRLHAALKLFVSPDTACHEQVIPELAPDNSCKKADKVADVLLPDGHIYEIQTGGFYPLKRKLALYLAATDSPVTVVHPIAFTKYLSWLDPADGTVLSRNKSPKHGKVTDIAGELYWLSDFIGQPRFTLTLLFLDIEEYRFRDGWSRDGKRGSSRYERFPTALVGKIELKSAADYAEWFLPPSIGTQPFTAAEYSRASRIRGRAAYGVLHLLTRLGVLREADEKIGRAQAFVRRSPSEQE